MVGIRATIILLAAFIGTTVSVFAQQSVQELTDEIIAKECKTAQKLGCSDCLDGFGTICYYDSKTATSVPQAGKYLIECNAYHHTSICKPCANEFKLRKESAMLDVSCRDFYEFIMRKQHDCGNCLKTTGVYGG